MVRYAYAKHVIPDFIGMGMAASVFRATSQLPGCAPEPVVVKYYRSMDFLREARISDGIIHSMQHPIAKQVFVPTMGFACGDEEPQIDGSVSMARVIVQKDCTRKVPHRRRPTVRPASVPPPGRW